MPSSPHDRRAPVSDDDASSPVTGRRSRAERASSWHYWTMWTFVPRELVYLVPGLLLSAMAFVVTVSVLVAGFALLSVFVGVFLLTGCLYIARGSGAVERARLEWAGRPRIQAPSWPDGAGERGFLTALVSPFADGHYWLYLLNVLVVAPLATLVSGTVTVVWAAGGVWALFAGGVVPMMTGRPGVPDVLVADGFAPFSTPMTSSISLVIVGLVLVATLPYVTRGFVAGHQVIGVALLGVWRSEALEQEVADLSASRGAAVIAEDRSLRRLERDIHDGPQQRLVRLQMDLALAERRIDTDPASAKRMIGEARIMAKETLDELRALSRGFAPPILQDRGLAVAIEALATVSPIPVVIEGAPGSLGTLPPELERSAYFIVSELLTNTTKHSEAALVSVYIGLRADRRPDVVWLDIWVHDDGVGGAEVESGHGLSGLRDRLQGLRGVLTLDSPVGGPTTVGAHIPILRAALEGGGGG